MFIALEGADGSGKTVVSKALTNYLREQGMEVIYTFEPTIDNEYGRTVRSLLNQKTMKDPLHFTHLLTADRKCHLKSTILPALSAGKWVICDRYKYSALAYQRMQGISPEYLVDINSSFLTPDLVCILQPETVATLLQRMTERGGKKEHFENKDMLESIISLYYQVPSFFPDDNIHFLNAELPVPSLVSKIVE